MYVKLTAGATDRIIDKEEREDQRLVQGQVRLRRWSMVAQPAQKLCLAPRGKVRKEKPPRK